jgi:protein-S-isoprenylcysteine O-methyltransferase Ste14
MSRGHLFVRAVVAFMALPGMAAFLIPAFIGYVDPWDIPFFAPGILIVAFGTIVVLLCIRDFYVGGKGTLAPWSPPQELVVVGLYRFVRNPMYLGVLCLVAGWAVLFRSPVLVAYDVVLILVFHLRVIKVEEPWLRKRFGDSWEKYQKHVPRWFPRKTAWEKS